MSKIYKNKQGFTLVELAIVMMIIGLLIGGILKGQELASNARVKAVIKEINSYSAAVTAFEDIYSSLPGDLATARNRIPYCDDSNHCLNGNGSGLVGRVWTNSSGWDVDQSGVSDLPEVETTMFWKHLVLSGLISGIMPNANPAEPAWGETHPASRMAGGYHVFADTQSAGSDISLRLQGPVTGAPMGATGGRPLTGRQAQQIDQKMDDGNPGDGSFWGVPFGEGGCRNGTGSGAHYVQSSMNRKNCAAHMITN